MKHHRPSRWLAPLALLAAMAAVLFVVSGSTSDGGGDNGTAEERQETAGADRRTSTNRTETGPRTSTTRRRRTYTVRPGDTLGVISERTGLTVEELEELNPRIDPNSLNPGDKIKLTE
ncbi:MAG: LysM peptidoglycan-binding domain-containing protein [Actinomycetota bacterium]|nr:LysM peptidoglycan-binding domain-containing protein [Actinomycetota bacterium]MDQ5808177.1 LysM peptidoglycan-binding domain-containing protein [Actinomycetota bacterium]